MCFLFPTLLLKSCLEVCSSRFASRDIAGTVLGYYFCFRLVHTHIHPSMWRGFFGDTSLCLLKKNDHTESLLVWLCKFVCLFVMYCSSVTMECPKTIPKKHLNLKQTQRSEGLPLSPAMVQHNLLRRLPVAVLQKKFDYLRQNSEPHSCLVSFEFLKHVHMFFLFSNLFSQFPAGQHTKKTLSTWDLERKLEKMIRRRKGMPSSSSE